MELVKISVAQIQSIVGDVKSNLNKIIYFVNKAIEEKSKFVIFGEGSLTGYTSKVEYIYYLDREHKSFKILSDIAKKGKINILMGANILEKGKIYNSYICIDSFGEISSYNKTHLGSREKNIYQRGNELKIFNKDGIIFGNAICIESHIPEIFSFYARNDANVVFVPFASPLVAGDRKEIWNKYLISRAYDNGLYIIAVNITGDNGLGLKYSGGIMAIDPKGNIIKEYYGNDENLLTFEVSKENTIKSNKNKNFLKYKRYELY